MPRISVNGLDVAYEVVGAGPPMVMLHGATSLGREDFAAQLPSFRKAFRVHLPDARGHGGTRWNPDDGFRLEWLIDDLEAFVDALAMATFHLVGFSMGAMTALHFASRRPERVRTLVVAGISTAREPRSSVARRLMDPARIDRDDPAFAERLSRRHDAAQGPGVWRRLLPAIAADVAVQPLLTPRQLHAIDAPALVVSGDRDPFVPVDHAWGLQRQLRDARLLVLPGCGHEVTALRPGLFNDAAATFFRETEPVARERAARARPAGSPAHAPGGAR